jgi:probable phosphoglycerate mutase
MLLLCVRHGQSQLNAEGRLQGQSDSGLTALGQRQSLAVAEVLRAEAVDALYCSPLQRAMETAQPIADALGLPIQTDPRLMEINAGSLQNQLLAELDRLYPEVMTRWHSGDPDYRFPDGESRRDLMRRGGEAFAAMRQAGHRRVVVVAHGALLVAAIKAVVGLPPQENPFSLHNCSITRLEWDDGQARLVSVNEIDHLATIGLGAKGEL